MNILDGGTSWVLPIDDELSDSKKYIWLPPILVNSKLLLVGGNKKLIVIDPYTGTINKIKNIPTIFKKS